MRVISALLVPIELMVCWQVQAVAAAQPPVDASAKTTASIETTVAKPKVVVPIRKTAPPLPPPAGPFKFSAEPKDSEFLFAPMLPERLVPIGGTPSADEDRQLAAALTVFGQHGGADNAQPLESFLESNPNSPWRAGLLVNLGLIYRAGGYWSKALEAWRSAWLLGKDETEETRYHLTDRALAELAELLARLGRVEELESLLSMVGGRHLHGTTTEKFSNAKVSLSLMHSEPGKSFRCGPFAVGCIWSMQHPGQSIADLLHESNCVPFKGTSLDQVRQFAQELGMSMQVAKRQPGASVLLPAVVHWKAGHYAALLRSGNNAFQIQDPTFGINMTISQKALDEEASGYFLVPTGDLPEGWSPVPQEDAETIWGKGAVPPTTDAPPPGFGPTIHPGCQLGMASYDVDPARVNLLLRDMPISYAPPRGPAINFTVNYSYRDSSSPSQPYSNLGPKWNLNVVGNQENDYWEALLVGGGVYVHPMTYMNVFGPGGGIIHFLLNPDTNIWESTPITNAKIRRASIIVGHEHIGDIIVDFPDGSQWVFASSWIQTESGGGGPLIGTLDAAGNETTYEYDFSGPSGFGRLSSVIDCMGQVSTFSYLTDDTNNSGYYTINRIEDPFGRIATFDYVGLLKKITDPVGIVSQFAYNGDELVTTLTTPYGDTTFAENDVGSNRRLDITDPNGETERVEFRYDDSAALPDAPIFSPNAHANMPAGMSLNPATPTGPNYWQYRNTYYWDKKAFAENPNDTHKAHLYHWLHTPDGVAMSDVAESEKVPLESRVFYNYSGQTSAPTLAGSDQPEKIGRVLDDGSTQVVQVYHNTLGHVTSVTTPSDGTVPPRTTYYVYAANGIDLTEVHQKNSAGASMAYFDTTDLLVSITYNSQHLPTTITDAAGQTTAIAYNSFGQPKTVANAKSETTTFTYDRDDDSNSETDGYLTTITGPVSGATTGIQYDGFGRVWKVTDSESRTVTLEYEAVGSDPTKTLHRPVKVIYPDSTFEQITYDRLDAEWFRDRMGRWSRTYHDAVRHVIATQDPLDRLTQFVWCGCGSLEAIIDPAGNQTTWLRDVQGRVTDKVFADNSAISYQYEPSTSRVATVTDAKGQVSTFTYQIDDQLSSVAYSNAAVATPGVSYTYDTTYGRLATMTDGTGTTTYTFNPITGTPTLGAGQLASIDGPLSNDTISYTYDELARLASRSINGTANTVSMTYDSLGRVATAVSNLVGAFAYHYVNATAQLSYVDYPNTQRVAFDYYPNTAASGTGNGDRRLKQIKNLGVGAGGTGPVISQFDYQYNVAGRISEWTQQNSGSAQGQKYALGYDGADQLQSATLKNATTGAILLQSNYGYDAAGNRTLEQIDQAPIPLGYDTLDRLTSRGAATDAISEMTIRGSLSEPAGVSIKNVTLSGSETVERVARVNAAGEFSATLPVKSGASNQLEIHAKDATGNETVKTVSVNPPTSTQTSFTYDDNGNTTGISDAGEPTRTYVWDALDRLVEVDYTETTKKTRIAYDGDDRWTKITEEDSGATTQVRQFVWDGLDVAEERDGSGSVVKRFFGEAEERGGTSLFNLTDHLGSVREVTGSSGTTKARYDYDLWGKSQYDGDGKRVKVTSDPSDPNFESDWGFTGHFQHEMSRLAMAPFRHYSAEWGRWLNRDPLGEEAGLNRYGYVANDPVLVRDPLGLELEFPKGYDPGPLMEYLMKSPSATYFLEKLASPSTPKVRVVFTTTYDFNYADYYAPDGRYIYWNPNAYLSFGSLGKNSPEMCFMHEGIHALHHMDDVNAYAKRRGNILPYPWDNQEEFRTILVEGNTVAKQLGETLRQGHRGGAFKPVQNIKK